MIQNSWYVAMPGPTEADAARGSGHAYETECEAADAARELAAGGQDAYVFRMSPVAWYAARPVSGN